MSALHSELDLIDTARDAADDIVAIAGGDRHRFEALFLRFAPKIKAYLMRQGVPAASAEELAQDTMLNVWRRAHQFNPNLGGAGAWIFTIARNARIDALRREKHPDALTKLWLSDNADPPTPEELILSHERLVRLEKALGDLSPAQMEVLRRSFLGVATLSQVAAELDFPLATAKSHLRRAIARLKLALDDRS